MLILDIDNNAILLCELKWLNSADSTSEVYARQDDIDKGVEQSEISLKYFKENLMDGLSRAFEKTIIDKVDFEKVTIGACVISKNTIRTTLDSIPVININQFTELCKKDGYNLKTIGVFQK